jgi:hypothetical protein
MCDQVIKVVDEISYLGVTLGNEGGWNKHKTNKW